VNAQRTYKGLDDTLPGERISRLEAIGFEKKSKADSRWDEMYQQLDSTKRNMVHVSTTPYKLLVHLIPMRVCFALFLEADCFQATVALTIKKIPVNEQDDENIPIARTSTQQPMFETKDTEIKVEVETAKKLSLRRMLTSIKTISSRLTRALKQVTCKHIATASNRT
jgi:hypothetical protein